MTGSNWCNGNSLMFVQLYKLSELIDGAELYSRIEETENADAYIDIIHKKGEQIQSGNTLEILDLV